MEEKIKISIPHLPNTKLKLFIDGEFRGFITSERLCAFRERIVKQILETKDPTILDRFYFIGHEDSNDKMGKKIKITMDVWGNLSDVPWELNHIRRSLMHLTELERDNKDTFFELEKEYNNGRN
jgi:hypothetical protein